LRACGAAIEAVRSPSRPAQIHFIAVSVEQEYTPGMGTGWDAARWLERCLLA